MPDETQPDILSLLMPQDADQATAMLAALQKQQGEQQARQAELRTRLGQQNSQAGNLRNLALLTSLGANPLLQGVNRTAGAQAEQMGGEAQRTEGLLGQSKASMLDPMRIATLQQAAERLRLAKEAGEENARIRAEQIRQAQEKIDLAKKRANAPPKPHAPPKAPTLPAGEVASLGDVDTAISGLNDLLVAHDSMAGSPMDALTSKLPGTQAAMFSDKVLAAAQAVGKILEGGKLAAGDEVKYRKMLPDAADSKERARQKVQNVVKLLQQGRQNKIKAFGQAGYNVGGIQPPDINLDGPPPVSAPPPSPTGVVSPGDSRNVKSTVTFTDPKDGKQKTLRTYADGRTTVTDN